MRHLGIDYGTKRVGVAISDEKGEFAFPHVVFVNDDKLVPAIGALVQEKGIGAIVVGDARALSGAGNPITKDTEFFAKTVEAFGVPVCMAMEAWSSVEARRFTDDARANDASAAAIILQRYLDQNVNLKNQPR